MASTRKKPHAICIPYPAQGHISPMMKLAKLLHSRGFHITFVHTEHNHRRLLKSRGPDSLEGLPSFRFATIPDGLPRTDANVTQDISSLSSSVQKNCLEPFKTLVLRLNEEAAKAATSSGDQRSLLPVTHIVSDSSMFFTLEASAELGIPLVFFWTSSASSFLGYAQYRRLLDEGIVPLKDSSYLTDGYLDKVIGWIPGMRGITLKGMPSFIRTTDKDDFLFNHMMKRAEKLSSSGIPFILNTFDALDNDVLQAISAFSPPIYAIGPLQLHLNNLEDGISDSIGSNLWKEEPECIRWLDAKDPNSVIYINFGSITTIRPHQFMEFAWGLARSNQNFLWIIRPDLVGGESSVLPPEFQSAVEGRGLLAGWCDQESVLKHPSVGGFLTHCGWNSMLESLCHGVPMICWPFFADQTTNSWFCCQRWGIGLEMNEEVKGDEIERLVKELITDKGDMMRKKAREWKRLAEEATTSPNGSSYMNLEKLIIQVLLNPNRYND
ncbi:hypothetical protein Droror1_Dr00019310 [Drosera rotundifolia]